MTPAVAEGEPATATPPQAETLAREPIQVAAEDLVPQVAGVLTVMDFYDMAAGSQIIFI